MLSLAFSKKQSDRLLLMQRTITVRVAYHQLKRNSSENPRLDEGLD
jgi:hypothetical protein